MPLIFIDCSQEKLQSAGTQPIRLKGEDADHSVSMQIAPQSKPKSPLVSENSMQQNYGTSMAVAATSSSSSSVSHRPLIFSSLDLKVCPFISYICHVIRSVVKLFSLSYFNFNIIYHRLSN